MRDYGHFRRLTLLLSAVLCIALVFGSGLPAFANIYVMDDNPISTTTNPGQPNDYAVVWREGWGNDPLAKFFIKIPQPTAQPAQPAIVGAHYVISRNEVPTNTVISSWKDSYNAILADGGTWNLTIDSVGEFVNPGPYMDTATLVKGAQRRYEGPYSVLFQFYANEVREAAYASFNYGLDMTPPVKVTNLQAIPGYNNPVINGVLTQSRVHFTWEDKRYDALAGTGYFELFMDGIPYPSIKDPAVSRRVYDLQEHDPSSPVVEVETPRKMTIEDLPAGKHRFQVRAVDRATNAGALSDPVVLTIDPDFPDINITWPSINGQVIGVAPTFKATVTDLGGVESVKFYVDGSLVAVDQVAPYEAAVDLSAYAQGTAHTLRVVAQDVGGRTNFMEKTFLIDKTRPALSLTSAGPSPFYPRKRDGYKDNFIARFRSSEPATATLVLKDSKGMVWRTISKRVPAGASSLSWNGKSDDNTMKSGTFRWSLKLNDTAGNLSAIKSGLVSLRYYEIVYVGGGARVIQR